MNRRNLERNKVRADISFRTMETTFLRDIRNFVSEENREKKLEKKKVKRGKKLLRIEKKKKKIHANQLFKQVVLRRHL